MPLSVNTSCPLSDNIVTIFSVDNSATDVTDLDDEGGIWGPDFRRSALYRYQRPGSHAFSLPSRLGLSEYFCS